MYVLIKRVLMRGHNEAVLVEMVLMRVTMYVLIKRVLMRGHNEAVLMRGHNVCSHPDSSNEGS